MPVMLNLEGCLNSRAKGLSWSEDASYIPHTQQFVVQRKKKKTQKTPNKTFLEIQTLMYVVYGESKLITLLVYVERLQRCTYEGQSIHDALFLRKGRISCLPFSNELGIKLN